QAEDGIRDLIVTGVQTCALPISPESLTQPVRSLGKGNLRDVLARVIEGPEPEAPQNTLPQEEDAEDRQRGQGPQGERRQPRKRRSEERRVGKECRSRGATSQ